MGKRKSTRKIEMNNNKSTTQQNSRDIIKRGGKNTQKNYTNNYFHDPDNHDGVITHLSQTSWKANSS